MTKEQAVEVLRCNTNLGYGIVIENESIQLIKEAIEMAIKALEQQPSEDCVSRKAVLDILMKCEKPCDDRQDFYLDSTTEFEEEIKEMPPVTPTQRWIPLVWDEYQTVDIDGNDDYVYVVDYSVPMPKEDEWVLITDENNNVVSVQYDGYDFGDYDREDILAWQPLSEPYEEKRGN